MLSPNDLRQLLDEVTASLRDLFGERLENVILYGSYARGDADDQSDVDILALVRDIPRDQLWRYQRRVTEATSPIDWRYDPLVSIVLEDVPTFEKYAEDMPFFMNVIREGIGLVQGKPG